MKLGGISLDEIRGTESALFEFDDYLAAMEDFFEYWYSLNQRGIISVVPIGSIAKYFLLMLNPYLVYVQDGLLNEEEQKILAQKCANMGIVIIAVSDKESEDDIVVPWY